MGTSAPYDAPPNWGELKSEVTRLAHEANLTAPQLRRLIQGVVRGNGGRTEMASGGRQGAAGSAGSAAPARDVASRFASFIADVRQNGFAAAAERAGLGDLTGKSVGDILNTLLDRLGGNASSIDDADARQALSDLQQELLADAQTFEEVQEILSSDTLDLENLLERFFGHYIFEQFSRVFYERLVQRVGAQQAVAFLGQIREFIQSALANRAAERDLSGIDWGGPQGANVISEICSQTLEVFGA
ncbi:hypothetical protein [Silvibacterium acidisoli]|uniref:hypothetical protein n=1 Tax=Acidobacteriaceae bacterium ZG23-2 TaxID=2883246 RepID=UPI00406CA87F